jgi:hypothetical protein
VSIYIIETLTLDLFKVGNSCLPVGYVMSKYGCKTRGVIDVQLLCTTLET